MANNTKIAEIKVEVIVTENNIESIMNAAIEGGIGYWAHLIKTGEKWDLKTKGLYTYEWATNLLINGETIEFVDRENEEKCWSLNLEKLLKGIELNYKNRPHDTNIENASETTGDSIIQYALFERIVYS
ncbi:hypothetical protein MHB48_10285 [Psychrobacillus sp. FSL H8-0483]|uniref:hypothetical protein n=1 Tax=Psychrobacillus sp. FSL H8-0483 TaxID=2921389 RepID=UPI00315A4E29